MASEPKKPLKGILRKTTSTPAAPTGHSSSPAINNARDARTIALHHANLLQTRKDTEAEIFDNTLTLLDLPTHPSHPPFSPHQDDTEVFTNLVRILQPSDYDDLITERNLDNNKCGYALCPNARRQFRSAGQYKLVNKGRKDFDIVATRELERWCSTECTRRALWIKVQLSETAAWERVGLPELRVGLYPEKDEAAAAATATETTKPVNNIDPEEEFTTDMAKFQLEQDHKSAQDKAALAVERGDDARDTSVRGVELCIREKKVSTQAHAPSLATESARTDTIEGYKPKFGGDIPAKAEDSDEDWV